MIMIPIVRPAFVALFSVLAAGCQTASLEDAAPRTVPVARAADGTIAADGLVDGSVAGSAETSSGNAPALTEVRSNPGIPSLVPIEQSAPVATREFVATGASRTGQYPSFGTQPRAANTQFSDADKLAAEAEITELLRNRASTPDARAQYEARLRRLRALAASHGDDMQQEIEN
ncbi:hypothetical protein [Hoeflea sp. AS16]|uniref:hypothetical protein n=1 Tax=unclassified Hoeflea TaxID=2614931 RepID=UPI0031724986